MAAEPNGSAEGSPEPNGTGRIKFRIVGDVQGVGMRAWIHSEATARNLKGWVRNEADSSVAALFIGYQDSLREMTDMLRQGSPAASVVDICELALDSCDINWDVSTGFSIRHDF